MRQITHINKSVQTWIKWHIPVIIKMKLIFEIVVLKIPILLHPFLCPWFPTALYIAWISTFKTRATIVQALFFMHNSIYKGKILNNPQIWDFSLLSPTTLNSNYNSAFMESKIAEESSPFYILQSVIYNICQGILERRFCWREIF